jgi:hypothetical protein
VGPTTAPLGAPLSQRRRGARREGFEEGRQDVLRCALILRFGALNPEHERTLTEASPERLDRLFERALTAPTAAAVFETP